MKNVNAIALSAADTASQTGDPIQADQLVSASFQAVFGDVTAAGTIKVQASNDPSTARYNSNNFQPTNWSDIPSATATVTAGVAPIIIIPNVVHEWLRVVYTRTSGGSTTVVVRMSAFGV